MIAERHEPTSLMSPNEKASPRKINEVGEKRLGGGELAEEENAPVDAPSASVRIHGDGDRPAFAALRL
jgi:hypothetical protein